MPTMRLQHLMILALTVYKSSIWDPIVAWLARSGAEEEGGGRSTVKGQGQKSHTQVKVKWRP